MKKIGIISIRSQLTEKILNNKKIIEIRKTKPKYELPIDIYIFCTHNRLLVKPVTNVKYISNDKYGKTFFGTTKKIIDIKILGQFSQLNGKVVAKFTLNRIERIDNSSVMDINLTPVCLTEEEYKKYVGNRQNVFAWHIDNLVKFDIPMELDEFYKNKYFKIKNDLENNKCNKEDCSYFIPNSILNCNWDICPKLRIARAPVSWCYAYTEKE